MRMSRPARSGLITPAFSSSRKAILAPDVVAEVALVTRVLLANPGDAAFGGHRGPLPPSRPLGQPR
jgi:hypothetical protein